MGEFRILSPPFGALDLLWTEGTGLLFLYTGDVDCDIVFNGRIGRQT